MYKSLIRPILFGKDPEEVHHQVFQQIRQWSKVPGARSMSSSLFCYKNSALQRKVFGLDFPNPVGLAAGFDKDGKLYDEFFDFGFGFVEVGTVTPRPQPGNDKPRLFRLPEDKALINRMGFNNDGVDALAKRLQGRKRKGRIIGGNIGKNKSTPNEEAVSDYLYCFEKLHDLVDYFVVNVSSPNTPGLRELQDKEPLLALLKTLQDRNNKLTTVRPILLKIAPDLSWPQLDDIIDIVKESGIAGVIATNTTINRNNLNTSEQRLSEIGAGGLSGKPLLDRSTDVVRYLAEKSNNSFPIIASGGIFNAEDAIRKIEAGASLVQVYTGFIYEGPGIVKSINKGLIKRNR